jgi:hypothetical protein
VQGVEAELASSGKLDAGTYPRRFILGIKETELRFDTPGASVPGGVEIALVNLLKANNHSDRPPAFFGLKKMGGRYHVYPKRIKTEVGDYQSYDSVLDDRISLEPKERICLEFWRDFCAALGRAANVPVWDPIGFVHGNIDACRTKLGGHDVPARQLLLAYLAEREDSPPWGLRSWELLSHAVGPPSFGLSENMVPLESRGKEYWITDVRPLAKAAQRFAEEFRTAVTYEDPLNLFEGDPDIADKATPEWLRATPEFRESVSTKERTLIFFLTAATHEDHRWIQRAVDSYNRGKDPPAKFEVRRIGEAFHIVPVEVKTTAGKYEPYRSPLDYRITVRPKDRACAEFLREFYSAVKQASGVALEGGATRPQENCRTALGGRNVLARSLLLDFVATQGRTADSGARSYDSWQLLSNPTKPRVLFLSLDVFRSQPPVMWPTAGPNSPPVMMPPGGFQSEVATPPPDEAPPSSSQSKLRPRPVP